MSLATISRTVTPRVFPEAPTPKPTMTMAEYAAIENKKAFGKWDRKCTNDEKRGPSYEEKRQARYALVCKMVSRSDGGVTTERVAEFLSLSKGAAALVLQRMVAEGLLVRPGKKDENRAVLYFTPDQLKKKPKAPKLQFIRHKGAQ